METLILSIDTPLKTNLQQSLINTELLFNKRKFYFSMVKLNENKVKFVVTTKDDNNNNIEFRNEYNFQTILSMNNYFKMFNNLTSLLNNLIVLIKQNNLEIKNYSDEVVILNIKVYSREENNFIIELKKVEISDKERINKLYKMFKDFKLNLEIKDKKIINLENQLSLLKNNNENFQKHILDELKEKEETIQKLENKISNLINEYYNLKEREKKMKVNEISNINLISFLDLKEEVKEIRDNILDNILNKSNIFQDKEEIKLVLSNIPKSVCNIRLLYNSKYEKENEEKIKNSYIGKNDIIFLIKTDKLRRFGAYAHESFEKKEFQKKDKKAFLFNLNKKNIFKSTGNKNTIWRGANSFDSINFGNSDLRIFHNFLKNQSLSYQGNDYDYKEQHYAVSGDEIFNVSSLEIYQAFLDD